MNLNKMTIEDIAFAIVRGGWPAAIGENEKTALQQALNYVEAVINYDVSRVDDIERSPTKVRALLRSLARNISTMATNKTIEDDIAMGIGDDTLSEKRSDSIWTH